MPLFSETWCRYVSSHTPGLVQIILQFAGSVALYTANTTTTATAYAATDDDDDAMLLMAVTLVMVVLDNP